MKEPVKNSTNFQENIFAVGFQLLNQNINKNKFGVIICHQENPRINVGNTSALATSALAQYGVRSPYGKQKAIINPAAIMAHFHHITPDQRTKPARTIGRRNRLTGLNPVPPMANMLPPAVKQAIVNHSIILLSPSQLLLSKRRTKTNLAFPSAFH